MDRSTDDYVRIYNRDVAKIYKEVKRPIMQGWAKHEWYNASSRTASSYDDKELEIRHLKDWPKLLDTCSKLMHDAVIEYAKELMQYASITAISHPRLNKYATGSLMRLHCDHIHSLFDGELKGIPVLTALCLLNDDFQGGEFLLCHKKVTLNAGDIIVFPSNFMYPHEVLEVTSGTRYSMVSWAW